MVIDKFLMQLCGHCLYVFCLYEYECLVEIVMQFHMVQPLIDLSLVKQIKFTILKFAKFELILTVLSFHQRMQRLFNLIFY